MSHPIKRVATVALATAALIVPSALTTSAHAVETTRAKTSAGVIQRALAANGSHFVFPGTTSFDGGGTIEFSSPHPYLHPVRTLGGVTVTATHPADHDWHTGVGFAVQDADGVNFWGGRTYVRDSGYETLDDHGRIEVLRTRQLDSDSSSGGVEHELVWRGPDGQPVLEERRSIRWRPIAFGDDRRA